MIFTGRLGKDAETKYTPSGTAICNFSVAVDFGYGDKKGTNWLRCSLFGKRAEGNLPQYLLKGTQVAISGELRMREFDDKDGNRRTSVEVNVSTLDLIGGRTDINQGVKTPQQATSAPQQQKTPAPDPFANAPDFPDAGVDDDIPF